MLWQGEPRDAAVNSIRNEFYNGIVRAVSLPQHGFLVVQTAVNHLEVLERTSQVAEYLF